MLLRNLIAIVLVNNLVASAQLPNWYPRISMEDNTGLLRECFKRQISGDFPTNGEKCSRFPKICFFGTQECSTGGVSHPTLKCECDGLLSEGSTQTWSCTEEVCPSTEVTGPLPIDVPESVASVKFSQPTNGMTVSSPFNVSMAALNFGVWPAGELKEGTGHFHIMINTPCVAVGTRIPADSQHRHYGLAQTEAVLDLAPGNYSLCLQMGDGFHTALALTELISITVAEPVVELPPSIRFVQPMNGMSVTSPFNVTMAAENFLVAPSGELKDGSGHFHIMINVPCVAVGEVIPADSQHRHYGGAQTETVLNLEPGEYTLCLQMGDGLHQALPISSSVTIMVLDSQVDQPLPVEIAPILEFGCKNTITFFDDEFMSMYLNYELTPTTLKAEIVREGIGWIGFGRAIQDGMTGSEVVIGSVSTPTAQAPTVEKYSVGGRARRLIDFMPDQTLTDTSFTQNATHTVMTFTKILTEPGELPITEGVNDWFIFAYGSDNDLAYHEDRDSRRLTLESCKQEK